MIPLTGAAFCRRDAVLTTSPATTPSPWAALAVRVTSASPVLTAIRTFRSRSASLSFSSCTAAHIASAALTARSGSSPRASGAPKTAMTASPMNFSTVPPHASICSRTRAKYGVRIARTSSGSRRSARAVKPTRSAKSTVTTLRSSASPCWAGSDSPQARQNFATGGFSWPHFGHVTMSGGYGGTRGWSSFRRTCGAGRERNRRRPRSPLWPRPR